MRFKLIVICVVLALLIGSLIKPNFSEANASSQLVYGANLAQMRPPIDDFAFAFNASIPIHNGVDWLREAAFVDQRHIANFTTLYNQYATYGYNWLLRLDILAVTDFYGDNWTLQNWDSYVTLVVNSFPNVHVWEVGNEVLSGQAQYNTGYLANGSLPNAYFNILKDAYQIIKSHNPSDTVIAFGGQDIPDLTKISLYNSGDFQDDPSYKLAAQVWAVGAAQYCDAISIHAYGDNTGASWLLNETPSYNGVVSTLTLQQIWGGLINEYETLTNKPIWFTETGEPIDSPPNDPTPPVISNSLAKQAAFLNQSFTFLSSFSFAKAVFWFKLVGPSEYYNNNVLLHTLDDGLFNQDGTLRPVTTAFESFSPGTSSPTPTVSPTPTTTSTPTITNSPTNTTASIPTLSSTLTPTNTPLVTVSTASTTPSVPELTPVILFGVITLVTTTFVILRKKQPKLEK